MARQTWRRGEDVARVISIVLFAPVIASPAFVLLLLKAKSPDPLDLGLVSFAFATAWPLAGLYGLYRAGRVPTVFVEERAKRSLPFVLAIAGYLIGTDVSSNSQHRRL